MSVTPVTMLSHIGRETRSSHKIIVSSCLTLSHSPNTHLTRDVASCLTLSHVSGLVVSCLTHITKLCVRQDKTMQQDKWANYVYN